MILVDVINIGGRTSRCCSSVSGKCGVATKTTKQKESLYPYVMGYWEWDDWSVWDGLVGLAWIGQAGID